MADANEANRESLRAVQVGTARKEQRKAVEAMQRIIDRTGADKGYAK